MQLFYFLGIAGDFIESPPPPPPPITTSPKLKRKKTRYDIIKGGISSILSESDEGDDSRESITTKQNGSSEEDNISNILKPTRYGRVPRARVSDPLDGDHAVKKRKIDEGPDKNQKEDLEPGSIVVVKTKTTTDDLVYKVYFVTDNQTKQQIDLTPKVLKDLTGLSGEGRGGDGGGIQTHNILTISTQKFSDTAPQNELTDATTEGQSICNQLVAEQPTVNSGNVEIIGDKILLPFDESLAQPVGNQNITVSHDDNKMIVVTEN